MSRPLLLPRLILPLLFLALLPLRSYSQGVCTARIEVVDTVIFYDTLGNIDSVRYRLSGPADADSLLWMPDTLFANPLASEQWVTLGFQDSLRVHLLAFYDSTNLFRWQEEGYVKSHTEYNYIDETTGGDFCQPGSITMGNNASRFCPEITYPVGSRTMAIRTDTTTCSEDYDTIVRYGIPKDSTFRPFYVDTVFMYDPTRSHTYILRMNYSSATEVMDSDYSLPVIFYTQHIEDTSLIAFDSIRFCDTTFTALVGYQRPGGRTVQSMMLTAHFNFYHRPHGMAIYRFYEKPQKLSLTKRSLVIPRLEMIGSCMAEDSLLLVGPLCWHLDTVRLYDTIVENQLPWSFQGDTLTQNGVYHYLLPGQFPECDTVLEYDLTVYRNVSDSTYHFICPNELPFTLDSVTVYGDTVYSVVLKGLHGEDSTVTRHLFVGIATDSAVYDTVVERDLPRAFFDSLFYDEVENVPFVIFNEAGCDSTIYYNLHVFWEGDHCDSTLVFPTLVTPNGDGINDRFAIGGLIDNECYPYNSLIVIDRTGRVLYRATNICHEEQFWDPDEHHVPDGTYFYEFTGHGVYHATHHAGCIEVLR